MQQTAPDPSLSRAELAAQRTSRAMVVCKEVIGEWSNTHCPGADLEMETKMLASRVNSWAAPLSVVAGTKDILSAARLEGHTLTEKAVSELGDRLARRLMEEDLLHAEPRRAGFRAR